MQASNVEALQGNEDRGQPKLVWCHCSLASPALVTSRDAGMAREGQILARTEGKLGCNVFSEWNAMQTLYACRVSFEALRLTYSDTDMGVYDNGSREYSLFPKSSVQWCLRWDRSGQARQVGAYYVAS